MRWRALVLVLAAGALVAPLSLARATAEPSQERIEELRAAVGHASEEEAEVMGVLAETRSRRGQLDAKVRAIDEELIAARSAVAAARAELGRATARYVALTAEVDITAAELDVTKAKFDDSTAAMYRGAGSGSTGPSLLFELSPEDVGIAQRYLEDTSRRHHQDADRYLDLKDELERQQQQLAEERARADELAKSAEAEEARVASLLDDLTEAREAAAAAEEEESAVLASITERKEEFSTELEQLEAESARLREQFAAAAAAADVAGPDGGGGGGAAPAADGQLLRPVNAPITSGFGPRTHPITGQQRMHSGVDFGAGQGTPIKAAESGTVATAGWSSGGFGNYVIINHGGGLQTLYAHQSSLAVGTGAQVSRGQVIGYVGSTGFSTGPHLHWEVWVNGSPVNPANYL